MRISFPALIAGFWVLVWVAQLIWNFDYYLNYNRPFLYACLAILVLSIIVFAYLAYKAYAPKVAYKVDSEGRCPDCFAKIGDQQFCPKCGKDLTGRGQARICPNCGYEELDPKVTSCPKCGKDFYK